MDIFGDIGKALGEAGPALAGGPGLLIGGLTTMGGSLINAQTQRQLNERQEANAWDMYQTERSDQASAHQREVEDLKKAGLNPILSAMGKGAGSASGNLPNPTAPQIQTPDIMAMVTSMANLDNLKAQNDKLKSEKLNIDADTTLKGKTIPGGILQDIYRSMKSTAEKATNYPDYLRKMYGWPQPKLTMPKGK